MTATESGPFLFDHDSDQDPVWWVLCVAGDALNTVVGPLWSEDDAKAEAAIDGCDNGHFVTTRMPPEDQWIEPPHTYLSDQPLSRLSTRLMWCLDWQRAHGRTPRQRREATEAGRAR